MPRTICKPRSAIRFKRGSTKRQMGPGCGSGSGRAFLVAHRAANDGAMNVNTSFERDPSGGLNEIRDANLTKHQRVRAGRGRRCSRSAAITRANNAALGAANDAGQPRADMNLVCPFGMGLACDAWC